MQIFLPYGSITESVRCLDNKRLGKQRVEALQIINVLTETPRKDGKPYKGWLNHPCVNMFRRNVFFLKMYHNQCIVEWVNRGFKNNMVLFELPYFSFIEKPEWYGNEDFHASHRSNLLRKDFDYYSKFGWNENPNDPYLWWDIDVNLWYKQYPNQTERIYIV